MIFFWLQELYMHMNILFLKLHTFVPDHVKGNIRKKE